MAANVMRQSCAHLYVKLYTVALSSIKVDTECTTPFRFCNALLIGWYSCLFILYSITNTISYYAFNQFLCSTLDIFWLIDWLIDCRIDWLIDFFIDWWLFFDWLIDLINWWNLNKRLESQEITIHLLQKVVHLLQFDWLHVWFS